MQNKKGDKIIDGIPSLEQRLFVVLDVLLERVRVFVDVFIVRDFQLYAADFLV